MSDIRSTTSIYIKKCCVDFNYHADWPVEWVVQPDVVANTVFIYHKSWIKIVVSIKVLLPAEVVV